MKQKNYLIFGAIVILMVAGIIFVSRYVQQRGPIDRVNPNIPPNFLYQSKLEKIPEQYLIVQNPDSDINIDLIYWDHKKNKFYCKFSDKEAEKIEYFYRSAGPNVEGGWSYRYALVCGNTYWILDAADSFGIRVYGPFEK